MMMKYVVYKSSESIDYAYEERVIEHDRPVFVCDREEDAKKWVANHAPNKRFAKTWYGQVELEDYYYIDSIPFFPAGEIDFDDEEEDDEW